MSVSVFSYAGKVTVGFLTDAGLVPDPQTLADGFREDCSPWRAPPDAGPPRSRSSLSTTLRADRLEHSSMSRFCE